MGKHDIIEVKVKHILVDAKYSKIKLIRLKNLHSLILFNTAIQYKQITCLNFEKQNIILSCIRISTELSFVKIIKFQTFQKGIAHKGLLRHLIIGIWCILEDLIDYNV